DGAQLGDDLAFEAYATDPSRIEPFENIFLLNVKPERMSNGGGGGSNAKGNEPGSGKGTQTSGSGEGKDSHLDIPRPIPVHEKDWGKHDPNFDKFTAMRIKRPPDAKEGDGRYDYFINMDNVYLQSFLKPKPKQAAILELRYSVAMTLVALS